MPNLIDLTGKQFGRLVVLERAANKGSKTKWKCRCECGSITFPHASSLQDGRTKSCGCLAKQTNTTHGLSGTRMHVCLENMKRRCHNPSDVGYRNYGGRGIEVCKSWRKGLAAFHADMGDMPAGMTIDRIDNDGDYEPGNCRWATKSEQSQNTRRNKIYTCYGKTQCLAAWCREYKIGYSCMVGRLKRMTIKEAIETPKHVYKASVIYEMNGRKQTLGAWCKELGVVQQSCAWARINTRGWTFEQAVTTPPLRK